jgi:hypothetical protein
MSALWFQDGTPSWSYEACSPLELFGPSGYDAIGGMKAAISCLHDAAPSGFEVLLAIIEAVAESGLQLIACLLEGVSHF